MQVNRILLNISILIFSFLSIMGCSSEEDILQMEEVVNTDQEVDDSENTADEDKKNNSPIEEEPTSVLYRSYNFLGAVKGPKKSDGLGDQISLSDNGVYLAAGASFSDGSKGKDSGRTYVFKIEGASITPLGNSIEGGGADYRLGDAVAISGDGKVVVSGAYAANGATGEVKASALNMGQWQDLGNALIGEKESVFFGTAVASNKDGSIIAIGEINNDEKGQSAGKVSVYQWKGGAWALLGDALYGDGSKELFGGAVALSASGEILAVGAALNKSNGASSGAVYTFRFAGGSWQTLGQTIIGSSFTATGSSLDLSASGTTLAVGSPLNGSEGESKGSVAVYSLVNNTWESKGIPIHGIEIKEELGRSVSLGGDGNLLLVGAPGPSLGERKIGLARIFQFDGSDWLQLGADIIGEEPFELFGSSVSISKANSRIAVAGPRNNASGEVRGIVKIYDLVK